MNVINTLIEVTLNDPGNFLKVKETLTRIGIPNKNKDTLTQSCHILHKQGKYYICGFKQMFMLDGKSANFTEEDQQRVNRIASLLDDWGLVEIINKEPLKLGKCPMSSIKIVPYKDKRNWTLVEKYTMGNDDRS